MTAPCKTRVRLALLATTLWLLPLVCSPGLGATALLSEAEQTAYAHAKELHIQGGTRLAEGHTDEGLPLLLDAWDMLESSEQRSLVSRRAKIAVRLGEAYRTFGALEEAEDWTELALSDATGIGKDKVRTDALHQLALIRGDMGDSAGSLALFDEAIAVAALVPDDIRRGKALVGRAASHDSLGDVASALTDYLAAQQVLAPYVEPEDGTDAGVERFYAHARYGIARDLGKLGYPMQALHDLKALIAQPELFSPAEMSGLLVSATWQAVDAGEQEQARELLEEASGWFDLHGPARIEPHLLGLEGELLRQEGEIERGCAIIESAAELARELGYLRYAVEFEAHVAECLMDAERPLRALDHARIARTLARQLSSESEWPATWQEARALADLGRLEESSRVFQEALDQLDAHVDSLELDALRMGLGGDTGGIYQEAADAALALPPHALAPAVALDALERGRSRLLLASVLGMDPIVPLPPSGWSPDDPDLRPPSPVDRTLRSAGLLRGLRAGTWDPADSARLAGIPSTSVAIEEMFRTGYSASHARIAGVSTVRTDLIRSRLPADLAVLTWRVGPDHTDLFVVDRRSVEHVRLPLGADEVTDLVRRYHREMAPRRDRPGDLASLQAVAEEAWQELVAPAVDHLEGVGTVAVVPEGPLFRLPFAALFDGERWLVERWRVLVTPSLNILDALLERPSLPRRGFVGVADPLGNLPAARGEVADAARHWPARATVLQGSEATSEAVLTAAPEATVLHFATHGQLLSADQPSYLELVDADGLPAPLTSDAILGIRLDASLVTLSACRSATGSTRGGEALINSLARSFLAAGARSVVGSLWDVDDTGTAALMSRFYDHLGGGAGGAEALALAQRGMIAGATSGGGERLDHPWFWAGFVMVGDPR